MELELLAALLAMPQAGSLEALAEVAGETPWLQAAVDQLHSTPLEEWQAEHTRLFISGHPHTPCPPFESVWREGKMMGHSLDKVQRLYVQAGFTPSAELPADFLGSELELLAAVLAQQPESPLLGEVANHLHGWILPFARQLQAESRLALYRVLGEKLEAVFT